MLGGQRTSAVWSCRHTSRLLKNEDGAFIGALAVGIPICSSRRCKSGVRDLAADRIETPGACGAACVSAYGNSYFNSLLAFASRRDRAMTLPERHPWGSDATGELTVARRSGKRRPSSALGRRTF